MIYGQVSEASINPPEAISSALNRLAWISKFGPPHVIISTDYSVEKVELERPWFLMTAWRLEIDGSVTSVEGAKSVLEHRMYMKNPLSKVSLVVPKPHRTISVFATVKNATGLVSEVLSHLGLLYARVVLGDYGGRHFVIDVDPVPRLENKEEALAVAELL
ncbi:MAG: hypothetical protein QW680_09750 [Pyrobaculum sp.]|nr:hypothetical protein [Pyrobaculum sp.]